jgi:hypothetical protein
LSVFLQPNDRKGIPADSSGIVVVVVVVVVDVETFESSQRQHFADVPRPEKNFLNVFVDQVLLRVSVVDVAILAVVGLEASSFHDFQKLQEIRPSQFVPIGDFRTINVFP